MGAISDILTEGPSLAHVQGQIFAPVEEKKRERPTLRQRMRNLRGGRLAAKRAVYAVTDSEGGDGRLLGCGAQGPKPSNLQAWEMHPW